MNPPFERTTCACAECVACCKRQSGPLIPSDIEPIRKFLKEVEQLEPLESYLVASRGSLVMNANTGETAWIGSITPKMIEDGSGRHCVFLDENDRCRIHAVSPAGCRYFDTHQGYVEGQKLGVWIAMEMQDQEYQDLRATLPKNKKQYDKKSTGTGVQESRAGSR